MALEWKGYGKFRFIVEGNFSPPNTVDYPPRTDGTYVIARCIEKLKSDANVVEGALYPIFWTFSSLKCDAPNPPFENGDGIGRSLEELIAIKYKKYNADNFEIIGDFGPFNTEKYPKPINSGKYKLAKCLKKLDGDSKVVIGGYYIIIAYPKMTTVDAPNPPFKKGQ